jgi:hypothetical protein
MMTYKHLKNVKILFSTPKKFNLFSWIIKKRINSEYSHVAIAVYIQTINFWDVYEASHGDVHIISMDKFLAQNKVVKAYQLFVPKDNWNKGIIYLKNQLTKKYSVIGAIASTISWLRKHKFGDDDDKKFICSEYASRYIEETGILNYAYDRANNDYITPKQFERAIKEVASDISETYTRKSHTN